jgi:hypothetical protein
MINMDARRTTMAANMPITRMPSAFHRFPVSVHRFNRTDELRNVIREREVLISGFTEIACFEETA